MSGTSSGAKSTSKGSNCMVPGCSQFGADTGTDRAASAGCSSTEGNLLSFARMTVPATDGGSGKRSTMAMLAA